MSADGSDDEMESQSQQLGTSPPPNGNDHDEAQEAEEADEDDDNSAPVDDREDDNGRGKSDETHSARPETPNRDDDGAGGEDGESSKKPVNSALYNGPKVKHLKKQDGIPLWRKDIQYDFLYAIFHDEQKVFTDVYEGTGGHTFCDIYLNAMARSSKTSKILRDKLVTGDKNSRSMAMVCLLVNLGRINTTLNFFLEMKAQLRTYHPIPSLQKDGDTDPNAYKQLQDAPRLKSILKGACEDKNQPTTVEGLMKLPVPRTNPINAVFLLSTYAPKITELHFPGSLDFFDLVMRYTLSAKTRARAFLWLMWYYLEGDFTNDACEKNPFGKGQEGPNGLNCVVPPFEYLTEEQAAEEDVDDPDEIVYGNHMTEERKKYLDNITSGVIPNVKRVTKKMLMSMSPDADGEGGSSAALGTTPAGRRTDKGGRSAGRSKTRKFMHYEPGAPPYDSDALDSDGASPLINRRLKLKSKDSPSSSSKSPHTRIIFKSKNMHVNHDVHQPSGARIILPTDPKGGTDRSTKPRLPNAYQLQMAEERKERIDHQTNKLIAASDAKMRKRRRREGVVWRAYKRIMVVDPLYDTEDELPAEHYVKQREECCYDFDENGKVYFKDEWAQMEKRKKRKLESNGNTNGHHTTDFDTDNDVTMAEPSSPVIRRHSTSVVHHRSSPAPQPEVEAPPVDVKDDSDSDADVTLMTLHNRRTDVENNPPPPALAKVKPPRTLETLRALIRHTTRSPSVPLASLHGNYSRYAGPAGLMPVWDEPEDFGEEVTARAKAFERASRRFQRINLDKKATEVESEEDDGSEGDSREEDGEGEVEVEEEEEEEEEEAEEGAPGEDTIMDVEGEVDGEEDAEGDEAEVSEED